MSGCQPILSSQLTSFKTLRCVNFAPRIFQLYANHDRNPHHGCSVSNAGGSAIKIVRSAPSRWTSTFTKKTTVIKVPQHPDQDRETPTDKGTFYYAASCNLPDMRQTVSTNESINSGTSASPGPDKSRKIDQRFSLQQEDAVASSVRRQEMRRCMRLVPQVAAIVTATDTGDSQSPWRGATVSSFSTVTFEPDIVVSLNLKLPSATFDAIQLSNRFDINMMKADARGAKLAAQFAKGHLSSPFADPETKVSVLNRQRFNCDSADIPPVLDIGTGEESPIAFTLSCIYLAQRSFHLGDHAVIFGTVRRVPSVTELSAFGETGTCLAYVDGLFGRVHPLPK